MFLLFEYVCIVNVELETIHDVFVMSHSFNGFDGMSHCDLFGTGLDTDMMIASSYTYLFIAIRNAGNENLPLAFFIYLISFFYLLKEKNEVQKLFFPRY